MFRLLKWLVWSLVAAGVVGAATVLWWLQHPMAPGLAPGQVLDVRIPAGASARQAAQRVADSGVATPAWAVFAWFRLSGQSRQIQAGAYELTAETTPRTLLTQLVNGDQAVRRVTLVEGWNYRQVLAALREADHLEYDLADHDTASLMRGLGLSASHPEGRFFPDTYVYPKYATASSVLRQAAQAMDRRLQEAWQARAPGLPLRSPEDMLILASIVEKETGLSSDRAMVSGVFINRLRIGMRLQTDPTVIYGLGPQFQGRLRRIHLDTDTPYNTYTRAGLPPTPIAMPGMASLLAAGQPARTDAMYFVARGDGSSAFSRTLDEHNRAVRRYILGQ